MNPSWYMKQTITNNLCIKASFVFLFLILCKMHTTAQLSPAWVQRYEGQGDNSDRFNDLAGDGNGNLYMAGYTYRNGNQRDFLVVKADSNGDTIWTRTINGSNQGDDEANAIAVDQAGNVYATGYADGEKSKYDFLTVKYDNSGNLLWEANYNYDQAYQDDTGMDIAVDSNGNVYVTGISDQSLTSTSNKDFATVKYDVNGVQVFAARKNGFGNGTDEPVAIAADNTGNCYVTGRSDSGSDDDYVTIKYDGAGVAQWTKLYDGGNDDDRPADLILTAGGDVIVTGREDAGPNDDITTIAYTNAGVQLWIRSFNGSGNGNDRGEALAVDASGNVYVTGESDADPSFNANIEFVTIKYSNIGVYQWSKYKGISAGNNTDSPKAIAIDAAGDIYVTGKGDSDAAAGINDDMLTVKYDPSGNEAWSKTSGGSSNLEDGGYAIVIDNSGNAIVAGKIDQTSTQLDGLLIKYDPAGNVVFDKPFNGEGDFSENAFSVKTDAAGNVFMAGYSFVQDHNRDILIRKYDAAGNTLETFMYNGSKSDEDEIADMVLDAAGNVYATGYSKSSGTSSDFITIKLDNNLDTAWVRLYNFTANESDKAVSVAVDLSGNVYVTGSSDNNPSDTADSDDIVTIKYNSSGAVQWTNRFNPPANGEDVASKVAVDPNGNTLVAGTSWNGSSDDMITIQYSPSGALQWAVSYNGVSGGEDEATDMVLDNAGNAYVTGSTFTSAAFDDYITVKYNSSGVVQWARAFNGTGNDDDRAMAITLDYQGNAYVTGQSDADGDTAIKNFDFVTVKYDPAGTFMWNADYDGAAGTDDIPEAIMADAAGNLYVAGQSENGSISFPNKDYALVIYSPSGSQLNYAVFDGPALETDGANAMCFGGNSLYLTGNSNGGNITRKDIATVKYDIAVGINEVAVHSGIYSFPNPSSAYLELRITGADHPSEFIVEFFDILGDKLLVPVTGENPLAFDVTDLPSGVYFYRVTDNTGSPLTGKFIRQ